MASLAKHKIQVEGDSKIYIISINQWSIVGWAMASVLMDMWPFLQIIEETRV